MNSMPLVDYVNAKNETGSCVPKPVGVILRFTVIVSGVCLLTLRRIFPGLRMT